MEKTTLVHKSEAKRSNWQPPTHSQTRQHSSHSSCGGCGACSRITQSTNASASLMLKSLDPGKKVCATSFLQRTYGNQYVQRLIQAKKDSPCLERCGSRTIQMKASGCCGGCANHGKEEEKTPIQAKLAIGKPGDKYEQEADRVADTVMRMPEVQRQPIEEEEEELQMQANMNLAQSVPPIEEEEQEQLQRKETGGSTPQVSINVQSQINNLKEGGQPLPESARTFFGPRFDYDFGSVRIHTDGRAQKIARSINARAFTVGRDVAFGVGEYSTETTEGRKLLAHELAHVVQQNPSHVQTKYSGLPRLPNRPVRIQAAASDVAVLQQWSIGAPVPGINTIVCNGSGGIAVQAGATGNAQQTACLRDCIVRHEKSHRADALAENARICNGQGAGRTVRPSSAAQRSATEIKASNVEIGCLKAKLPRASRVCKPIINARITQMETYRDSF